MSDKKSSNIPFVKEIEETPLGMVDQFTKKDEQIYYASQGKLIMWRFQRHKLAVISLMILVVMYIMALVPGFFAPYTAEDRFKGFSYAAPSSIRWFAEGEGFVGPYVYGTKTEIDMETFRKDIVEDMEGPRYPLGFFVKGVPYKIVGNINWDRHLFGLKEYNPDVPVFIFGSDQIGRDLFSRTIWGSQISLTIGLVGVFIAFMIGISLGGVAGYVGGLFDAIILLLIDLLQTIPHLPLWMVLSAAVPREIPVPQRYFMMTLVLSFLSWTGLARVVRGRLLAMREEDYALAAKGAGANNWRIVMHHLIPGFTSHLIVTITINIPGMILGEVALGFLGLGMIKPAVSWGILLQDAQNITSIAHQPWLMIPAVVVIVTVLLFNFVGDGLRDAADPFVM
jgi:peptide/nickel transport system permease protein